MTRQHRLRARLAAAMVLATSVAVAGCAASSAPAGPGSGAARVAASALATASPTPSPTPPPPPELPRGGRELLPHYRIVAYYGSGTSAGLGVLGHESPEATAPKVAAQAAKFASPDRTVLPGFELITTAAQAHPGKDGLYTNPESAKVVQHYLDVARANKMYLILDFQPGQSRFLPQVQMYEQFIKQPDVGVALDSEWRMGPGEVPGQKVGHVEASEVNEVSAYVEQVTKDNNLPQKLLLLHQFQLQMLRDKDQIQQRADLAMMIHADGFGPRQLKLDVFKVLDIQPPFFVGFKLFYDPKLDKNIFSPQELLQILMPPPDMISYQ